MSDKTATIFLNNISVIDLAYIDEQGRICGMSLSPQIEITGIEDPEEHVVVDFSTIKKDIKRAFDDDDHGMDHKLWYIQGISKGELRNYGDSIIIETPIFKVTTPKNAMYICRDEVQLLWNTSDIEMFEMALTRFLERHFQNNSAIESINVKLPDFKDLKKTFQQSLPPTNQLEFEEITVPFHYIHGLKDSTSWGCQNIAHGHYSFMQIMVLKNKKNKGAIKAFKEFLKHNLENAHYVFLKQENGTLHPNDVPDLNISYKSRDRDNMVMWIDTDVYVEAELHKIVALETETTIENLVAYFASWLKEVQPEAFELIKCLYVSEGLDKGSFVHGGRLNSVADSFPPAKTIG